MARALAPHQLVERSITKKYRRELWNPFIEAVKTYRLINEGDCLAVPLQNEAAQLLLAKLLQQLQRVSEVPFDVCFYAENERAAATAETLHIPLSTTPQGVKTALAVTRTDAVEHLLSRMLFDGVTEGILPKTVEASGVTVLPLFCVSRAAVDAWAQYNALSVEAPAETERLRQVRQLTAELQRKNPDFERNVFQSLHALCLNTFPAYTYHGESHTISEDF